MVLAHVDRQAIFFTVSWRETHTFPSGNKGLMCSWVSLTCHNTPTFFFLPLKTERLQAWASSAVCLDHGGMFSGLHECFLNCAVGVQVGLSQVFATSRKCEPGKKKERKNSKKKKNSFNKSCADLLLPEKCSARMKAFAWNQCREVGMILFRRA